MLSLVAGVWVEREVFAGGAVVGWRACWKSPLHGNMMLQIILPDVKPNCDLRIISC